MTNEEAIKILNDYDINFERNTAEEVAEAHEMAIEALKAQSCNDCISRDATLTAFSDYVGGGMSMNDFDAMWDIVVKMPSVEPRLKAVGARGDIPLQQSVPKMPQPSEHTEERTETHECDCISRQAAIDALENTKEVAR